MPWMLYEAKIVTVDGHIILGGPITVTAARFMALNDEYMHVFVALDEYDDRKTLRQTWQTFPLRLVRQVPRL